MSGYTFVDAWRQGDAYSYSNTPSYGSDAGSASSSGGDSYNIHTPDPSYNTSYSDSYAVPAESFKCNSATGDSYNPGTSTNYGAAGMSGYGTAPAAHDHAYGSAYYSGYGAASANNGHAHQYNAYGQATSSSVASTASVYNPHYATGASGGGEVMKAQPPYYSVPPGKCAVNNGGYKACEVICEGNTCAYHEAMMEAELKFYRSEALATFMKTHERGVYA